MLLEGHHIRHDLAGMRKLGETIDDGNLGILGQFLHHVVFEDADHDCIDIARQHPRGIGDGLAPPELHLAAGEHQGLAAQFAHAHIEGNAGVRVEGLSKTMARTLPASGLTACGCPLRRLLLIAALSAKIRRSSSPSKAVRSVK